MTRLASIALAALAGCAPSGPSPAMQRFEEASAKYGALQKQLATEGAKHCALTPDQRRASIDRTWAIERRKPGGRSYGSILLDAHTLEEAGGCR